MRMINTHRIPFAVCIHLPFEKLTCSQMLLPMWQIKSGGHTGNPDFSSSHGILISMTRFNRVDYEPKSATATIGAGQVWDNVYEKLAQYEVTVLGARVTHIGVAGFILGGGMYVTLQFLASFSLAVRVLLADQSIWLGN